MADIPEIDLTDPRTLTDPVGAHGRARERSALARMPVPGMAGFWVVTRYEQARELLADPRFGPDARSFMRPAGIPEHCRPYLRTMAELDGPEHRRLRRLVAPAFSARRAEAFRATVQPIVDALLDALPEGEIDLLARFALPLPMLVICALVGIPESDRPRWREHGAAVAAGHGEAFAAAVPALLADAEAAIDQADSPLLDDLRQAQDGDRLSPTELVTLVWHLVLAGQTPTNLIANAVPALLAHPDQLAALRADPTLLPGAIEELMRWCGPQLLTTPRYAAQEVELAGIRIGAGEPVVVSIVGANHDPRAFAAPDRFDLKRSFDRTPHLGFSHGPHFCLGAALARVQTEVALGTLLRRFPDLALAGEPRTRPDPGTWRLAELPIRPEKEHVDH